MAADHLDDPLGDEEAPEELQPREEDVGDEESHHQRRGLARALRLELRKRICHGDGGDGGAATTPRVAVRMVAAGRRPKLTLPCQNFDAHAAAAAAAASTLTTQRTLPELRADVRPVDDSHRDEDDHEGGAHVLIGERHGLLQGRVELEEVHEGERHLRSRGAGLAQLEEPAR